MVDSVAKTTFIGKGTDDSWKYAKIDVDLPVGKRFNVSTILTFTNVI